MVPHDGVTVGQTKLLTIGDSDRIATSKPVSISEGVSLRQRARTRPVIVFAAEARLAQAWLDPCGDPAEDVAFHFAHKDRRVDVLTSYKGAGEFLMDGE